MSDWVSIEKPSDFKGIVKHLSLMYNPNEVAAQLSSLISDKVKGVLIEYNYIDKDYRSTFYNFYAKKAKYYSDKCVRLHLFGEGIKFEDKEFDFNVSGEKLNDGYMGFFVLRPTELSTFGRTIISPKARKSANGWIVTSAHKVHVMGHTLEVKGFPWMNQHSDISACAHVVCWAVLRHYSERYNKYAEYLTHEVTLLAKDSDPGGLAPSSGLFSNEAEKIFYRTGTYPILVEKNGKELEDQSFYRQLGCYLDSGFPLFISLDDIYHAIAVIGINLKDKFPIKKQPQFAWENVSALVGIDDNFLPYRLIKNAKAPDNPNGKNYTSGNITSFIVPLPEKIYYPASSVDDVATKFPDASPVSVPREDERVVRYFVTTSAAYKRFVREHINEFDPVLARAIFTLPMAQFIWIVEYATIAQWEESRISTRAVLDATASAADNNMFWMYFDDKEAYLFDRSLPEKPRTKLTLKAMEQRYSRMQSNLDAF